MVGNKMIRDPMYGYVEIAPDFAALVDTPEFQRLRNIVQTGYQALYPSALHNRFVHSLGVYHLGCKAIDSFWTNLCDDIPSDKLPEGLKDRWPVYRRTFLAACLLHDVGHSPFSHTGEAFYNKGADFRRELAGAMKADLDEKDEPTTGSDEARRFCRDMKASPKNTGNPHEAMSALVGAELCERCGMAVSIDLFIRAIIGTQYRPEEEQPLELEQVILNAVIGLLNGSLIDVDKLDYIGRDAYVTGYSSLTLDVDRLLAGYTVGELPDKTWGAVYKKGSLSVIENVIYANDMERRWIQNHPAILYDGQLIDILLRRFDSAMRSGIDGETPPTVFTRQAISVQGMPDLQRPLKLLCDDDIITYIKNEDDSEIGKQFFDRKKRLKPLWKTEADFEYLVNKNLTADIQKLLAADLDGVRSHIQTHGRLFIDDDLMQELRREVEDAEELGDSSTYRRTLEMCGLFEDFTREYGLGRFQYVLVLADKFQTGYRKLELENIHVRLGSGIVSLKEILSVRAKEANHGSPKALFYVYTVPENLEAGGDLGAAFMDFLRRHYRRPA